MTDLNVALRVVARDLGSREVKRAIAEVDRATGQSGRSQQRTIAATARASRQGNAITLRDSQRLHQSREQLGIRSEKSLQREIVRTAVAYKRLEQSGRLSGQELSRAADAASTKIRRLQGEMRRLNGVSGGGAKNLMAASGAILGGVAAATMVARQPLSKVMDYDRQIAVMSNTAYAGRDVTGRQAGQADIKAAISRAVQSAGGTRESAADALNELFSTSGLTRDEAFVLLPQVQRFGLATGRDGGREVAGLIGALKAQGIAPENMADALGKMLYAGQTGGFGIENMVSVLPRVLQAQRDNFGISGVAGLEAALANLTGITAASAMPQEAAQSYAALLNTLKNPAVAQAVADKLSIDGRAVDLQGTLAKGVAAGVDPLETFAAMLDGGLAGNSQFQALKQKLAGNTDQSALEELSTMLESTVLRDVGIGRQDLLAFSAFVQQREAIKSARVDYANRGAGVIDASSAVVRATASERMNDAKQSWDEGRQRALEPLADTIGDVAGKLSAYANQYPGLTSAVVAATDAIKVMTAAALVFGGIKMLAGKGAAGLGVGSATAASRSAGRIPGIGNVLKRAAPVAVAAEVAYQGYRIATSDASGEEKAIAAAQLAGQTGGGVAGAYGGALAGTAVMPGVGTAIGAVLGGLGGGFFGDWFGEKLGNLFFASKPDETEAEDPTVALMRQTLATPASPMTQADLADAIRYMREQPVEVDVKVSVDVENGNIVASVNEANAREARRH